MITAFREASNHRRYSIMLMIYQRIKYGPTGGQDRLGFVLEIVSP